MKTTLDLPDDLVKQLKLRAIYEGKKLKQAVADTLREGLAARRATSATRGGRADAKRERGIIKKDRKTGLPVIQCRRAASREQELTPQRVADILVVQEAGWARDAG